MNDLSANLDSVWLALMNIAKGDGASIMFISPNQGAGTSFASQNFAKLSQSRATKAVWLLDLDFFANKQLENFKRSGAKFTGPFDMSFGIRPFWRLLPNSQDVDLRSIIIGMRVDNSKLFISKFRSEKLKSGQNIQIGPAPKYWQNLKEHIELTIIDAPSTDISRAGLVIAQDIDAIVIVVNEQTDFDQTAILRDEIIARGGNIIGLVVVESINANKMARA